LKNKKHIQTKERKKERSFLKIQRLVKVVIDALTTTRHAQKQGGKYKLM
jgi:hypothetical protein